MTGFFEDFGGHVAWGTARCGEDVEGFFVYDARETKISDKQVRVFCGGAEEEVFGFEVYISILFCGWMEVPRWTIPWS